MIYHRRRRAGVSYGIMDLAHAAVVGAMESGVGWLWVWTVGIACWLQAIWTRAGKAFAQATPLYWTGISCLSMTWNSSAINVANSSLYSSR